MGAIRPEEPPVHSLTPDLTERGSENTAAQGFHIHSNRMMEVKREGKRERQKDKDTDIVRHGERDRKSVV